MTLITIDGVVTQALVSCHRNGRFSYHDGVDWVRNSLTVPRAVLD